MKITIVPNQVPGYRADIHTLYNLIKRSQEDLLSRNPLLKEFILEINHRPLPPGVSNTFHNCTYRISDDGSIIHVTLVFMHIPNENKAYQLISGEIEKIKQAC